MLAGVAVPTAGHGRRLSPR